MSALIKPADLSTGVVSREEFDDFIRRILPQLDKLSTDQQRELLATIEHIRKLDLIVEARTSFVAFIKLIFPWYKFSSKGQHHRLANAFERLVDGDLKRLTISMAPRFSKSESGSVALPAWFLGKYPVKKVIQASSNSELATDFGRKVKNIISSPLYSEIFPGVQLSADSKASGKFATNQGGEYHTLGVSSNAAGKGGDLIVLDDIVSEQEARTGDVKVYETAWQWFQQGPLQRLQPSGRILIIGTRWAKADPIGKVQARMKVDPNADRYESIEFPALDENDESMFPELWPTKELIAKRNNMLPMFWNTQYQQRPTASSSSIVPKSWWKVWDKTNLNGDYVTPECFFTIMSFDTAYTNNKRSNPTACTIWGVFKRKRDEKEENNIILMHSYSKKMEFGTLKTEAKRLIKEWNPDLILIEAKSSGPWLRNELAEAGIFTEPSMPKPGEDKMVRLNMVSDVFMSGNVWYVPTRENEACVEQIGDFPNGDGDDFVDTASQAIRRFRQGGLVSTANDVQDEDEEQPIVDRGYY